MTVQWTVRPEVPEPAGETGGPLAVDEVDVDHSKSEEQ